MTSEVDVANMALDAVGARTSIASFTENSKESNACARHFENVVTSILRMVPWGWARKQVTLTLLADATAGQSVPTPWTYKYLYPSDCKKFRYIVPMYQSVQPSSMVPGTPVTPVYRGPPIKWILNSDTDSLGSPITTILTNQMQAIGVYTFRAPVTIWDDLFIDCVVGALATRICIPVSGDKALLKMAVADAEKSMMDARVANGNEAIQQQQTMPDWMRVRGYLSDYAYPDLFLWSEDPGILSAID